MARRIPRVVVGSALVLTIGLMGCAQLGGPISSSSEPVAENRWEAIGSITDGDITAIIHDGKNYVAVTVSGIVLTSDDMAEWTVRSTVGNTEVSDIAYKDGVYIVVGDKMYRSANLRGWEENLATITHNLNAIVARGSSFWTVGDKGKILSSADGHTWISAPSPTSANLNAIDGTPGNMTVVGDKGVILMNQGALWVEAQEAKNGQPNLYGVTYVTGTFLAVGAQGTTWSSSSGLDGWVEHPSGSAGWLLDVTYLGVSGQFVAVGTNGAVVVSEDGSRWTSQAFASSADLWSVISVNGSTVYAVGESGTVASRITESNTED